MNHERIRELLQTNRFGELNNAQQQQVDAHLAGCAECRGFAEDLAGLDAALSRSLHAHLDPLPGPHTRPEAMMRTIGQRERQGGLTPAFSFASVLALVGLVVGLVWVLQRALPDRPGLPVAGPATGSATSTVVRVTDTPAAARTPEATSQDLTGPVQVETGGPLTAFMSVADRNTEIFLQAAGAPQPVNLTRNPAEDTQPVWSPDGAWIAFYSDRTGRREIFLTDVNGEVVRQLTDTPDGEEWLGPPAWSPDGTALLAIHLFGVSERSEGRLVYESAELARIQTDGSGYEALLAERIDFQPTGNYNWSPGGSRAAFTSLRPEDGPGSASDEEELYIVRADGLGSQEPVTVVQGRINGIAWLPHGERLAYLVQGPYRTDEQGEYSPAPESEASLWVYDLQVSEPQRVADLPSGDRPWRLLGVSPEGERLLMSSDLDRDGCWTLFWIYPDGSGLQEAPEICWAAGDAGEPQWTAGGQYLLVPAVKVEAPDETILLSVPAWPVGEEIREVVRLQESAPGSGTSGAAIRPGLRLERGLERLSQAQAEALIREALLEEKPGLDPQFDLPLMEIPEAQVWERLGAQLFRVSGGLFENETFLIRGEMVVRLGTAVGGRGVSALKVTDLDSDGTAELVYAYSFGSGIQQTRLGMYAPALYPEGTFTADMGYRGELALFGEGLTTASVRIARPQPGRMVIDALVVLGELKIEGKGQDARLVLQLNEDLPPEVAGQVIPAP